MSALKDLTGLRFGRLVVIRRAGTTRYGESTWVCLCDCGSERIIAGSSLRRGYSKSCGCLRDEIVSKVQSSHRKTKTRLYNVWTHMIQRCCNPKHIAYSRYGGRGITVCDEWRNSFEEFYKWAMFTGYDENAAFHQCTIDRIDNDKGYSPENCRWADAATQNRNKSNNRKVVNQ